MPKTDVTIQCMPSTAKEKALKIIEDGFGQADDLEVIRYVYFLCKEKGLSVSAYRVQITEKKGPVLVNFDEETLQDLIQANIELR